MSSCVMAQSKCLEMLEMVFLRRLDESSLLEKEGGGVVEMEEEGGGGGGGGGDATAGAGVAGGGVTERAVLADAPFSTAAARLSVPTCDAIRFHVFALSSSTTFAYIDFTLSYFFAGGWVATGAGAGALKDDFPAFQLPGAYDWAAAEFARSVCTTREYVDCTLLFGAAAA